MQLIFWSNSSAERFVMTRVEWMLNYLPLNQTLHFH